MEELKGTTNLAKLDVWEKRWKDNQLRWHKSLVNPYLIKYCNLLLSQNASLLLSSTPEKGEESTRSVQTTQTQDTLPNNDVSPKKVFIPLCGKTMDIGYILSLGHTIFAIEGVKQAIEILDSENSFNLEFNFEESLYSTSDGRLKIYCGNIFKCPIEKWGPFDCIWDRGSLTALDQRLWPEYKNVIQRSVQGKNFKYLLVVFDYDKSRADGRGPKCVDEGDMKSLYDDWTSYNLLESVHLPERHVIRTMVGEGSPCFENIYMLVNKN